QFLRKTSSTSENANTDLVFNLLPMEGALLERHQRRGHPFNPLLVFAGFHALDPFRDDTHAGFIHHTGGDVWHPAQSRFVHAEKNDGAVGVSWSDQLDIVDFKSAVGGIDIHQAHVL